MIIRGDKILFKDAIQKIKFSDLNLADTFFDSLRNDYKGFDDWFKRKQVQGFEAYVLLIDGSIEGFLSLKSENESDENISPAFENKNRLKISTFKINAHRTSLGQRFLSIIFQNFVEGGYDEVYVTLFEKQSALINLFTKFGFNRWGVKKSNGELVYIKNKLIVNDIYKDFPFINTDGNKFLLSIYPSYHTDMFPDSRLNNETDKFIEDLSYTNTIEKTYIARMSPIKYIKKNDSIVIYRTKPKDSIVSAEYVSVATSVCKVVDVIRLKDFKDEQELIKYCGRGSIFSDEQIKSYYHSSYDYYVIKMLYNVALNHRINRKSLFDDVGIPRKENGRNTYFGVYKLTDSMFNSILRIGEVNEGVIVD